MNPKTNATTAPALPALETELPPITLAGTEYALPPATARDWLACRRHLAREQLRARLDAVAALRAALPADEWQRQFDRKVDEVSKAMLAVDVDPGAVDISDDDLTAWLRSAKGAAFITHRLLERTEHAGQFAVDEIESMILDEHFAEVAEVAAARAAADAAAEDAADAAAAAATPAGSGGGGEDETENEEEEGRQ